MCLCCWAQQAYDCVAQAEAHMTTGRAFSVRSSTKSFSHRNLSDAITASVFLPELYQQLFPTSLSKKCDLNQSSTLQGSTQCWLMNGFSFMVWDIMWTSKDAKKESTPNVSVSQEYFRFMRHLLTKPWTIKDVSQIWLFGWSKFRFLTSTNTDEHSSKVNAWKWNSFYTLNCNVRKIWSLKIKIEAARTNEKQDQN